MSEAGDNEDTVEIIIRMQTHPDQNVKCPAKWTVLQLKEHLSEILIFQPDVSHQRLIYGGHCLENTKTIRQLVKGSAKKSGLEGTPTSQVFHLAYSNREALHNSEQTPPGLGGGIRRRTNAATNDASNNFSADFSQGTHQMNPQDPQDYYPFYQNFMNPYGMIMNQPFALQFQQPAIGGLPQFPYNRLVQFPPFPIARVPPGALVFPQFDPSIAILAPGQQNQFNAGVPGDMVGGGGVVAQVFGVDGAAVPPQIAFAAAMAAHAHRVNAGLAGANVQQVDGVNGANIVQVGGVNQPVAPVRDGEGNRPDFLDAIYRTIRFFLLAMVVYAYSSVERFFVVLLTVSIIWFVQMQRDQRNRQANQPPNDIGFREAPNENHNEPQNGQMNGGVAAAGNNVELQQNHSTNSADNSRDVSARLPAPNAWALIWTTVSSFFTSLVPENHVPIN